MESAIRPGPPLLSSSPELCSALLCSLIGFREKGGYIIYGPVGGFDSFLCSCCCCSSLLRTALCLQCSNWFAGTYPLTLFRYSIFFRYCYIFFMPWFSNFLPSASREYTCLCQGLHDAHKVISFLCW